MRGGERRGCVGVYRVQGGGKDSKWGIYMYWRLKDSISES